MRAEPERTLALWVSQWGSLIPMLLLVSAGTGLAVFITFVERGLTIADQDFAQTRINVGALKRRLQSESTIPSKIWEDAFAHYQPWPGSKKDHPKNYDLDNWCRASHYKPGSTLRKFVSSNRQVIAETRQASRAGSVAWKLNPENGIGMDFPFGRLLPKLIAVLLAEARIAAVDNNWRLFWIDILAAFEVSQSFNKTQSEFGIVILFRKMLQRRCSETIRFALSIKGADLEFPESRKLFDTLYEILGEKDDLSLAVRNTYLNMSYTTARTIANRISPNQLSGKPHKIPRWLYAPALSYSASTETFRTRFTQLIQDIETLESSGHFPDLRGYKSYLTSGFDAENLADMFNFTVGMESNLIDSVQSQKSLARGTILSLLVIKHFKEKGVWPINLEEVIARPEVRIDPLSPSGKQFEFTSRNGTIQINSLHGKQIKGVPITQSGSGLLEEDSGDSDV